MASPSLRFLDIFEYESVEDAVTHRLYHNCTILKDYSIYRKDTKFDCITLTLEMRVWVGDNDDEIFLHL